MKISMNRETLLAALNDRLLAAKKEDDRLAKSHRADEEKALKRFGEQLRVAAKWDWKTLKANYFRVDLNNRPSCPMLNAPRIARVIEWVGRDTRKAPWRIDESSDIGRALMWKPERDKSPRTVCD